MDSDTQSLPSTWTDRPRSERCPSPQCAGAAVSGAHALPSARPSWSAARLNAGTACEIGVKLGSDHNFHGGQALCIHLYHKKRTAQGKNAHEVPFTRLHDALQELASTQARTASNPKPPQPTPAPLPACTRGASCPPPTVAPPRAQTTGRCAAGHG